MTRLGLPTAQPRALAEAIVDVHEKRDLLAGNPEASRVLGTAEVAGLLGRNRRCAYDHSGELGAFPFGESPPARVGFDVLASRPTDERWPCHPMGIVRRRPPGDWDLMPACRLGVSYAEFPLLCKTLREALVDFDANAPLGGKRSTWP
jgi:hypothetical protein